MKKVTMMVVLIIAFAMVAMASADDHPLIGKPAPDITATDYEGNTVNLSDFKGKAVMVVFYFPT